MGLFSHVIIFSCYFLLVTISGFWPFDSIQLNVEGCWVFVDKISSATFIHFPVQLTCCCYTVRFEKCSEAGRTTYSIVGYVTVYQYYAYPDMKRPRIR